MAILLNIHTGGVMWRKLGVTVDKVRTHQELISHGSPALWEYVRQQIDVAVAKGYLPEGPG